MFLLLVLQGINAKSGPIGLRVLMIRIPAHGPKNKQVVVAVVFVPEPAAWSEHFVIESLHSVTALSLATYIYIYVCINTQRYIYIYTYIHTQTHKILLSV